MKPIYQPTGKAREYGDYAINIYTGCPHRCFYCFAPNVLHRDRETFHSHVEPRPGIVEAVKAQLEREQITGKLIHLCFTCDPYPTGYDSTPTREIIKLLKAHGNHVQILTKGDGIRDFDSPDVLMYLDPPYVRSARRSGALYAHEMDASGQEELLRIIKSSHAKIIISGYESDLYNTALAGWHKDHTMSQTTSTEMAEETIWMNYEPPTHQLSIFENNEQLKGDQR